MYFRKISSNFCGLINTDFFYYRYPANPSGLGFSLPIRFQTGSTLLKLATKCKEIIPEIDFPFIVFHDPMDRVVLFPGKCVRQTLKESLNLIQKNHTTYISFLLFFVIFHSSFLSSLILFVCLFVCLFVHSILISLAYYFFLFFLIFSYFFLFLSHRYEASNGIVWYK